VESLRSEWVSSDLKPWMLDDDDDLYGQWLQVSHKFW
jgi:hypothetical protein